MLANALAFFPALCRCRHSEGEWLRVSQHHVYRRVAAWKHFLHASGTHDRNVLGSFAPLLKSVFPFAVGAGIGGQFVVLFGAHTILVFPACFIGQFLPDVYQRRK